MKPLGDMFIQVIKMVIAPIIFCTVVHGIASMKDMKKVGRVGLKAIVYFEVVTTLALVVGLIVVNSVQPGAGMNVDPPLDTKSIQQYTDEGAQQSAVDFLPHIIPPPSSAPSPRARSCRSCSSRSCSLCPLVSGRARKPLLRLIDLVSHALFGVVAIIMRAAPLGAFGAMAFTIGKYGVGSLCLLGQLMAAFYATCLIFIFLVLGTHRAVLRASAFSSSSGTSRKSC